LKKIDFAVGGQAVIEGVMMRSPNNIVIAVIEGILMILGFLALDYFFGVVIPSPIFWGIITIVLAMLPIIGASAVWGIAAIVVLLEKFVHLLILVLNVKILLIVLVILILMEMFVILILILVLGVVLLVIVLIQPLFVQTLKIV